jgi:hypothetical protein
MLHFGFWQLSGRQLFDVVSAFVLPTACLWWGAIWARRDFRLFVCCLLSYSMGGLIFLVAALLRTKGLSWFEPYTDPGSLLMAWGSQASMNVRSIEQNGILALVWAPVGLMLLLGRRKWLASLILLASLIGLLSVLPLAHGRLWIVSLAIACWPSVATIYIRIWHRIKVLDYPLLFLFGLSFIAVTFSYIWPYRRSFCDERFGMYYQALQHWPQLIAGGRTLTFKVLYCDGHTLGSVSTLPESSADISMMHSVPFDIVSTIGLLPSLPIIIVLFLAAASFLSYTIYWLKHDVEPAATSDLYLFWTVLSVMVPQWLFQPLIYGDGLLYYLSYCTLGALLVIQYPRAT